MTHTADVAPVTTALLTVVTLPDEIDMANADAIGEEFAAALAPGVRVVIADMTATTFCGSAGINMLIRAKKRAAACARSRRDGPGAAGRQRSQPERAGEPAVRSMGSVMRRRPARSLEADVQDEVPQPQVEHAAAGPVHDERQQDDGQDGDDHPEEEHHDAGNGIPGHSSRSTSHGRQLPAAARLIRREIRVSLNAHRQRRRPAGRFGSMKPAQIAPLGRFGRSPARGRLAAHNQAARCVGLRSQVVAGLFVIFAGALRGGAGDGTGVPDGRRWLLVRAVPDFLCI